MSFTIKANCQNDRQVIHRRKSPEAALKRARGLLNGLSALGLRCRRPCACANPSGLQGACDGSGRRRRAFGDCGSPWRPRAGRPLRRAAGRRPDVPRRFPSRQNNAAHLPDRGFRPRRRRPGSVGRRCCRSETQRRRGNDHRALLWRWWKGTEETRAPNSISGSEQLDCEPVDQRESNQRCDAPP
jgi:hypothetical protein